MCATKTCAPAITVSVLSEWKRPAFMTAMIAVIEAFQEARAMRRAAKAVYPLGDE